MSKKILISSVALGLTLSTSIASAQGIGLALSRSLSLGHRGADVSALQEFLASDSDVYPEALVTGYFGPLTSKAVQKFQAKHGIESIGIVGPKTRARIQLLFSEGTGNSGRVPPGLAKKFGLTATSSTTTPPTLPPPGNATSTPGQQVMICHIPPGNPAARHTITVGAPAIRAHMAHGDTPGPCPGGGTGTTTPPVNPPPPTADTTAPVISGLTTANIASTSVNITWQTDEVADSTVWYSTTTPLDPFASTTVSVTNASLVTSHVLSLNSLLASTTYFAIVRSRDSALNTATSSQFSFTTN